MDMLRLEYELKKKNLSIDDYCKRIGMCRSAYYRKKSGKTQFTLDEIKKTCDLLELESPMEIFFADRVS